LGLVSEDNIAVSSAKVAIKVSSVVGMSAVEGTQDASLWYSCLYRVVLG